MPVVNNTKRRVLIKKVEDGKYAVYHCESKTASKIAEYREMKKNIKKEEIDIRLGNMENSCKVMDAILDRRVIDLSLASSDNPQVKLLEEHVAKAQEFIKKEEVFKLHKKKQELFDNYLTRFLMNTIEQDTANKSIKKHNIFATLPDSANASFLFCTKCGCATDLYFEPPCGHIVCKTCMMGGNQTDKKSSCKCPIENCQTVLDKEMQERIFTDPRKSSSMCFKCGKETQEKVCGKHELGCEYIRCAEHLEDIRSQIYGNDGKRVELIVGYCPNCETNSNDVLSTFAKKFN